MSTRYLDEFIVNGTSYTIEERDPEGDFGMRAYGCGIGVAKTRANAREQLHAYICSKLRAERDGHQQKADEANAALAKLEGDTFNLARFMK